MEISTSLGRSATSCTLLDQSVGFKCLAALLGVGGSRLEKKAAGNPDLRYGKRAHESKPGTWTVDGFLQVAYDALAETLPDELLSTYSRIFNLFPAVPKGSQNMFYCFVLIQSRKIFQYSQISVSVMNIQNKIN